MAGYFGSKSLPLRPVLLLWLAVSAILIWSGWDAIVTRSGWDPDDQLRMVQLRDFLAGQSWFDTTQYRLNPPFGGPMHWSRLIELPLALIVMIFAPLVGQAHAEMIAGTVVPLLLLGAIAYILGRIATRLANPEAGLVAVLLALISPALLMQSRPMRIDHHEWQIFMAVIALWTMFWPAKRTGGAVLGTALAIWMHISLEGAPMMVAFFLILGWRWVIEKAHGQRLMWGIGSFALTSLFLFVATQPRPFAAPAYCDSVSPPHLAAIILAAAIMIPSILVRPDHRRFRIAAAGLAGVAALAALLWIAPQCASGAFGGLDPLVRDYWYVHVKEGLPVWRQDMTAGAVLLAGPLLGLLALHFVQQKADGHASKDMRLAGFFMIYSVLLSLLVFRTVSVASAFAIPMAAVWINALFQQYRRSGDPVRRITIVALMLFLLIPGAVVGQLIGFGKMALGDANPANIAIKAATDQCESANSVASLASLPPSRFVAPFDIGPMILLTTPHSVLASSHHRNRQGMHDHIEIFRLPPDASHALIVKRGIQYVAACPGEAELGFYVKKDPKGLWATLAKGETPAWLEQLPDRGEGIKLWRVR